MVEAMKQKLGLALVVVLALGLVSLPGPVGQGGNRAEAAQSTTKKSSAKKPAKKTTSKKSYCGYPAPPLPAGMSDYCAMQYDLYCRRGVGCNQFGR